MESQPQNPEFRNNPENYIHVLMQTADKHDESTFIKKHQWIHWKTE